MFLTVAIATVAMPFFAVPALAQTSPASATPTDRCAVATSVLEQLPAAPTNLASVTTPVTPMTGMPTSYADMVLPGRGIEISAGTISGDTRLGATFIGEMSGDLPGVLNSSVNYTPPSPSPSVTNNIVGGEWALCGPWGTVFGTFTGGTVQWNADEIIADVAASITVSGGSVNGVPVSAGAGTFGGMLDHRPLAQGLPPMVSGSLQLQASGMPTTGGTLPGTGGPPLVLPAAASFIVPSLLGLGIILRRSLVGSS
ncbi:MAG: hypothetical protein LC740_14255 [Actinobacteria bacterium]|nr:hypothetical protein [Actinomycetota bacterium]